MKKGLIISAITAASVALAASPQINSTDNQGYMARSEAMFRNNNFAGCLDQLSHLDRTVLTDDARENADWLMAQSAYRVSGPKTAMAYFRVFLANYPQSLRRHEAAARVADCLFAMERYDLAIKAYGQVDADALPSHLREKLIYRTAYSNLRQGFTDEAAALFTTLEHNRTWGNAARFYLGYIAYDRRDYDAATARFKTVNTGVMPGTLADYYLSQIYFLRGEYGQALSGARSLLRRANDAVDPSYTAEARRIAGESLYRQGKTSEAIPYLHQYIAEVDAPRLSALYITGLEEYAAGNYDEAVSLLEPVSASLGKTDNDAMAQSAYLYIGQALHKSDKTDAALMAFDKALKCDADTKVREAAYYNYAVAKFAGASIPFGSSVATFEDFLRNYPEGPYAKDVQEYLVSGYLADDNYEKALEGLERIPVPTARVQEGKQTVLYTLGARALADGKPDRALQYLTKAEPLAKYNPEIGAETVLLTAEALAAKGNNGTAVERFNEYLRITGPQAPNRAVALYALGYSEFALKNYDAAEKTFTRAFEATDNKATRADILNRLADIRYYASAFPEAADLYARAYDENPSAGDYSLFQKALMRGFRRDYKGKEEALETFRATFPTSSLMPDAMLELTEALLHQNRQGRAVEIYRTLTNEYPATSQGRQGYIQMALTLLNMGRKTEGIQAYKDVISLYPTSEEAAQAATFLKNIYTEDGKVDEYLAFINSVDGAPRPDEDEPEAMTFEAAERDFTQNGRTSRLENFVSTYPAASRTPRALEMLMRDADESGRREQAYRYAEAIVSRFPDHSAAESALIVKAEEEYDMGRGNAALESWQRLEQKASTPEKVNIARMGIMRVGRDIADYPMVLRVTEAILSSSAAGSEARNEAVFSRALALDRTGRTDEARVLWKSIAANTDDLYGAKSAFALAESLYDARELDKALAAAQDLTGSGTPHKYWLGRGFILLSDIYAAQGKDFEAKEYLRALRENYPGDESDIFEMIDSRLN